MFCERCVVSFVVTAGLATSRREMGVSVWREGCKARWTLCRYSGRVWWCLPICHRSENRDVELLQLRPASHLRINHSIVRVRVRMRSCLCRAEGESDDESEGEGDGDGENVREGQNEDEGEGESEGDDEVVGCVHSQGKSIRLISGGEWSSPAPGRSQIPLQRRPPNPLSSAAPQGPEACGHFPAGGEGGGGGPEALIDAKQASRRWEAWRIGGRGRERGRQRRMGGWRMAWWWGAVVADCRMSDCQVGTTSTCYT